MSSALALIGWWLAVLAVCIAAKQLSSVWYEFNRRQGIQANETVAVAIGVLAILVVASVETFRPIDCLLDKKTRKMFRHAGSALIASALLLYPLWGYDLGNPIEHARFALLRKRADECAAAAHRSYSTYEFNICETRFAWSHDHFLVYDTSGQIALRRDARSSEFADYLKKSESWMYTECPFKSTEFAPHFFYMETYFCDAPARMRLATMTVRYTNPIRDNSFE